MTQAQPNTPATNARQDLILESREFAEAVVKKIMKSMSLPAELISELLAAADFGLVEAAHNFDFNRGSDFRSYAYLRIRGSVIDAVRKISSISRNSYMYGKALEAVQLLRENQIAEIQESATKPMNGDEMLAKVFDIAADGALAFRLSYEDIETEVAEEANKELNPEEHLCRDRFRSQLRSIIATLPEAERTIIEGYYFHDKQFVDIANEEAGLSKSWVSRLHGRAIRMLRDKMLELDEKNSLEEHI